MRKLELKIETCGDCPYCYDRNVAYPMDEAKYLCSQLGEGGSEYSVKWDELAPDCPLPLYIEGQKELS